jgi:hypothetical protein
MKRLIYFVILVLSIMLVSCEEKKKEAALIPENTISVDREYMALNYGGDYLWFETVIVMKDYLDEESTGKIESVESIFQKVYMSPDSTSADVKVIRIMHTLDCDSVEVTDSFWMEDSPLNDMKITITYEDAFNIVMESNCIKPHSRYCVLRRPVGDTCAFYIFGNEERQIFVSAESGKIIEGD